MDGVDGEDSLFEVVPDQFVAARNALVRRLRSDGAKAEATRVAKLRRPPLTAWALNQVARTAPALIEELVVAGGQLRAAMERALAGDASGLGPGRAAERGAVDAVVAAAARCLERAGFPVTDVMRPRMAATLRAAVVDESVAGRLRQGVLDGDCDAPGFGLDALSGRQPAGERQPSAEPPPAAGESPAPVQAPADREQQEQRRREADEEASRPAAEAEELIAEAERLAHDADHLARDAERLASEAQEADKRAVEARGRADAAAHRAEAAVTAAATAVPAREADPPR